MELIGRQAEKQKIYNALASKEPELVAIWGRRRVGKTYLVRYGRQQVKDHYLEITGQKNGNRKTQLGHFTEALSKAFHKGIELKVPGTWGEAFKQLEKSIDNIAKDGKPITVFFDEAPWLDSRRSGFLDALEYFWNTVGTKLPRLKVFVCGSAASWIIQKIVKGKGGWHRRVTRKILLLPFTLDECMAYLKIRGIKLSEIDVIRLYMILGGVPYYLSLMERGESIAVFIDRLFFSKAPELDGEFDELFDSLFSNSENHKKIITLLASNKSGFIRDEIIQKTPFKSGGTLNRYLDNLEQSGFIETHLPLGKSAGIYKRYRVCDMFTLFHLRWLKKKARLQSWQAIVTSQSYKTWCGHSFEILAWNHANNLALSLGVGKSDYNVTRAAGIIDDNKVQIDLVLDVRGGALYMFELKFYDQEYIITSAEAKKITLRKDMLINYNGHRSIIVCLLVPLGAKKNKHLDDAIDLVLTSGVFFN